MRGTILSANLVMQDGNFRERQGIDINERISNEDGQPEFSYAVGWIHLGRGNSMVFNSALISSSRFIMEHRIEFSS